MKSTMMKTLVCSVVVMLFLLFSALQNKSLGVQNTEFKEHKKEYPPGQFSNRHAEEALQVRVPDFKAKVTFQSFGEQKLLASVLDAEDNPIRGLHGKDFVVQRGSKKAKILSVEPLETSKEVPLNIVLVVDNSFSMKERQAVKSLLSALEEFFKTVRPIDNIHAVVFAKDQTMEVNEFTLHTKTFSEQLVTTVTNAGLETHRVELF